LENVRLNLPDSLAKNRGQQMLFLLPLGEGQDEGGQAGAFVGLKELND
jgi:hypothetical protein